MQRQIYEFPANHDGSPDVRLSDAGAYHCCCQLIHVKTGACIIGVLECVCLLLQLLATLAEAWEKGEVTSEFWITMFLLSFFTFVVVSLFVSIRCQLPFLLLLHLAIQVIAIVMVGMAAALIIVLMLLDATDTLSTLFSSDDFAHRPNDHSILFTSGLMAFCYSFATAFEVWFLIVVWRCYQFLRKKHDDGKPKYQMHAIVEQ